MRSVKQWWLLVWLISGCLAQVAWADTVSGAQRRAAADYLAAVSSGGGQAVAFALHPDELQRLRDNLLKSLTTTKLGFLILGLLKFIMYLTAI